MVKLTLPVATLVGLCSAVACGGSGGGGGGSPPSPGPLPTTTTTAGWTDEGTRLTPSAFAPNQGQIADSSVVRLRDGRWRIYVAVFGTGIRTATSTDGLSFAPESDAALAPGTRLPGGLDLPSPTHPRAVLLDDGRVRVYVLGTPEVVHSMICPPEGVPCSLEAGERISVRSFAVRSSGIGIYRLADGTWRAYFGTRAAGEPESSTVLRSATSTDGINWTHEPGVRIGVGATLLTKNAEHPSVVINTNGSVTVFFFRFGGQTPADDGIWYATSADGLAFTAETKVLNRIGSGDGFGDPDAVRLPDGRIRLYASWTFSPPGQPVNQWAIKSYVGQLATAALGEAAGGQLRATALTNDIVRLRVVTDHMIDSLSPVRIPAGHSLRDRLARAENDFRHNGHPPISEDDIVSVLQYVANQSSALAWMGSTASEVRALRHRAASNLGQSMRRHPFTDTASLSGMSPVEAVHVTMSLANAKIDDAVSAPIAAGYRRAFDAWLTDESSAASVNAHRLLDRLGIRR